MKGKKGLIMGVANERSIAWGISQKLAEEIVNAQKGSWIYESPDGGKTVFRRPAGSYDSKDKVEIDWETKEPTGRVFSDYNNGNWKGDEG